jgi:predicted aspartyl protease
MARRVAALLLAALASACAPATPVAMVAGRVDPEVVRAVADEAPGTNCALHRRASVPLDLSGLAVVTAQINGRPATLILDTGAESTLLTASAAKRLGVTSKYDFERSMAGIGGSVRTGDARLSSMSLGGLALDYPRVLVGELSFHIGDAEPDGLLGASLLDAFDLDIDVPRRRLDLYDRVDCAQARPAWSGRYATLETTRSLSEHPFFPITVNGRTLSATLDTGAQRTVISARAAASSGIGAESQLAGPPIKTRGAVGETVPATLHSLRDAKVGGIALRTPVLVVPATLPRDIDALLGLDFLMSNRVWLSYGSRRIFIQPG